MEKDAVYDVFKRYVNGDAITIDDSIYYMNHYFSIQQYRLAFVFANHVVRDDPTNGDAVFILGVVYCDVLQDYAMARRMFRALVDAGVRVDDSIAYLNRCV